MYLSAYFGEKGCRITLVKISCCNKHSILVCIVQLGTYSLFAEKLIAIIFCNVTKTWKKSTLQPDSPQKCYCWSW